MIYEHTHKFIARKMGQDYTNFVDKTLSDYSRDGWEVVSSVNTGDEWSIFFFRRPLTYSIPLEDHSKTVTMAEFTEIMREADKLFETLGGGTRHFVRDCLFPILEKEGISITKNKP
jgi:hypothetical protein